MQPTGAIADARYVQPAYLQPCFRYFKHRKHFYKHLSDLEPSHVMRQITRFRIAFTDSERIDISLP